MKVLILAGGLGTRFSEQTEFIPKPMIPIGEHPILWHIMKIYSHYGFNDFIILLGYKGYVIKEYFANYFLHQSDVRIDIVNNQISYINNNAEPWKITMIDTGGNTMTGGRILRAKDYVGYEPFMVTYGDGVGNVDIKELIDFHQSHGKYVTMTSVKPEGRFGALEIDPSSGHISQFIEKPDGDDQWVNGGFFVCQPQIFEYLAEGDATVWEKAPLETLAKESQLVAYKHTGFWQPMDTQRDNTLLSQQWNRKEALWKVW